MKETWYASKACSRQGLVADEATGANIAVVYDDKHTNLIAAAPDLLREMERLVTYYESEETRPEAVAKLRDSRAAIAKARGD
jgi:hypothetical protein